ncbi:MAG: NADH:ubiquinone oxidoreductase subunit K [Candidatus Omnitrophota bacterium]|jgi:NADH:ubiquinone oxidoreductase subunit K
MSENPQIYILLSAVLFSLGIYGVLSRRNVIAILISIELLLNAANINFITFDKFVGNGHVNGTGQIFSIFVIALAAAEICVALSIVILLTRQGKSALIEDSKDIKG